MKTGDDIVFVKQTASSLKLYAILGIFDSDQRDIFEGVIEFVVNLFSRS